ncbi:MAG: DUF4293 domain-containing protein [Bacteroidales bacterium]|nr:DUF4293 domain-containing protein [Bacteroidales bacterium]
MIQRIQSLYLLIISLLSLLLINGAYLTYTDTSGAVQSLYVIGLSRAVFQVAVTERIVEILVALIPLLAFTAIFLFSKRTVQMMLTKIVIALIVVFIGVTCYLLFVVIPSDTSLNSWFKMLVPAVQLLLAVMAYSGIKRDDNLIKSYDRLR